MTGSDSLNLESNWKRTTLWKMIQDDQSALGSVVCSTLNSCMPSIQLILDKGGTAAPDFTLHDGGHAFRVAERMCQIIPNEVLGKLTVYEIAFLLLSAYLHDIGMTPELKMVTAHYSFLLTGDSQTLSQEDISDFQKWLDDDGRGITLPLAKAQPTNRDLQICQETITYYARARHNDWGAKWISKNLGSYTLGQYQNWIEDITKLCRSHHLGYNELKESPFNPVVMNPGGTIVHLRFLACVLRVADILEFDPERTPNVIFRHRNVRPSSRIYWWRDHEVTLVQEGNNLSIHARPSDAQTDHAIRVMAEAINSELKICRMLAEQTHFEICPGLDRSLPHQWTLSTTVSLNIVPREGAYEYINGAFRPNTDKLLQLLSGTALYGNPLMAVRELLQNAFDAVREKIAYTRLSQKVPADPKLALQIEELHTVSLRFEIDDDGYHLVCTDNGVGMTRSIIENHLLVSGTTARHDVLALERRCLQNGFLLGRTGQFGIGVLSYFMISDRVVIITKRSQEPGDSEDTGWRFETAGVGSFGELKRYKNSPLGTQVWLHLRSELVGQKPEEWFASLYAFIERTLKHIPCKFELTSSLPECPTISIGPGWCRRSDYFTKKLLAEIKRDEYRVQARTPLELLPSVQRQAIEQEEKHFEGIRNEARKCLRWKVIECDIPDGLGRARFHIPYFDLLGNVSLAFLRVTQKSRNLIVGRLANGYMVTPSGHSRESWKGMTIASSMEYESVKGVFVEIDWYSVAAGDIGVNRSRFLSKGPNRKSVSWIWKHARALKKEIVRCERKSVFWFLNCRLTGIEAGTERPLNWLAFEKVNANAGAKWKPLEFPLIPRNTFIFSETLNQKISWNRSKVHVRPNLQNLHQEKSHHGLTWYFNDTPPDRILLLRESYSIKKMKAIVLKPFSLAPIWISPPKFIPRPHVAGVISKFPTQWPTLCGVEFEHYFGFEEEMQIWNPDHSIVSYIESEGWDWCVKKFSSSLDPLPLRDQVLSKRSRASAWVVRCLRSGSHELWDGLRDRAPQFLRDLWQVLFPEAGQSRSEEKTICQWVQTSGSGRLRILSPNGWVVAHAGKDDGNIVIKKYFPDPGLEWMLTVKSRHGDV